MTDEKKIKVHFAPGAFDNFEGTQEELDELVAEIQAMFANKTAEELEAESIPLTEDEYEELPDEVKLQLYRHRAESGNDEDIDDSFKRRLQ